MSHETDAEASAPWPVRSALASAAPRSRAKAARLRPR